MKQKKRETGMTAKNELSFKSGFTSVEVKSETKQLENKVKTWNNLGKLTVCIYPVYFAQMWDPSLATHGLNGIPIVVRKCVCIWVCVCVCDRERER